MNIPKTKKQKSYLSYQMLNLYSFKSSQLYLKNWVCAVESLIDATTSATCAFGLMHFSWRHSYYLKTNSISAAEVVVHSWIFQKIMVCPFKCATCALWNLCRYVKRNWLRVVESLIVATLSATSAFGLIYFYQDCKPIGAANITRPLQV